MMSGAVVDRALQRLHAVPRFDDVEPGELEVLAIHLAGVRIVVHEQHAGTSGFAVHFRPLVGSVSVKVEPLPSCSARVIRPPSIWARRRQIDRPRPVPPYARVGELSSCRKSSKMLVLIGAGDADARCRSPPAPASARRSLRLRRDRDPAVMGELERVAQQVEQDLLDLLAIARDRPEVLRTAAA